MIIHPGVPVGKMEHLSISTMYVRILEEISGVTLLNSLNPGHQPSSPWIRMLN